MKELAVVVKSESQLLHQQNEALITIVSNVQAGTANRMAQEKAVQDDFEVISVDLKKCDQVIIQTTGKVVAIGEAVSQFSGAVLDIQQSQEMFSDAVNNFCFFVSQQALAKAAEMETEHDDFIDLLRRQNDENDVIIEEIKRFMA